MANLSFGTALFGPGCPIPLCFACRKNSLAGDLSVIEIPVYDEEDNERFILISYFPPESIEAEWKDTHKGLSPEEYEANREAIELAVEEYDYDAAARGMEIAEDRAFDRWKERRLS